MRYKCEITVKFTMCKLLIELKVKKKYHKNKPCHAQCYSMNADQHFMWITEFFLIQHLVFGIDQIFLFSSFLLFIWWFMILLLCDTVKVLLWFDMSLAIQRNFHSSTSHFAFAYMYCVRIHTPYAFWIFTTSIIYSFSFFCTLFISVFIAFLMPCFGHVLFILHSSLSYLTMIQALHLAKIWNIIKYVVPVVMAGVFVFHSIPFCLFLFDKIRDFTLNSNCSCIT